MAIKVETTQRVIDYLISYFTFKNDYSLFNGEKDFLLVEGATDKEFMEMIRSESTYTLVADNVIKSRDQLISTNYSIGSKTAIAEILFGLNVAHKLLDLPKGYEKWKLYGMIDSDFDSEKDYSRTRNLFLTDTHDLETLLLSTDESLLSRLSISGLTEGTTKKALYLAYQLGFIKGVMLDNNVQKDLPIKFISAGTMSIDFNSFTKDCVINVKQLFSYINRENGKELNSPKLDKAIASFIAKAKRYFDATGNWKQSFENFCASSPDGVWDVINGHDFLAAIRFLNKEAEARYGYASTERYREFEYDLIRNYDYSCLKDTNLYNGMFHADLVKQI